MNHPGFHFVISVVCPQVKFGTDDERKIIRLALATTPLDDRPIFRVGGDLKNVPYTTFADRVLWDWLDNYKEVFFCDGEPREFYGRVTVDQVRCWKVSCRSPGYRDIAMRLPQMNLIEAKRWLTNGILPERP